MAKEWTLKELDKETCRTFGGNNCVLHGCMFGCVLWDAKLAAAKKEGVKVEDIKSCNKN